MTLPHLLLPTSTLQSTISFRPILFNFIQLINPGLLHLLKQLIKGRQLAFYSGDAQLWRLYRRKVQTEIKARRRKFYEEKVRNTRKDDVRQWWRTVHVMSGRTYSQYCFTLEREGVALSEGELAESLNQYLPTVAADIPPLDTS